MFFKQKKCLPRLVLNCVPPNELQKKTVWFRPWRSNPSNRSPSARHRKYPKSPRDRTLLRHPPNHPSSVVSASRRPLARWLGCFGEMHHFLFLLAKKKNSPLVGEVGWKFWPFMPYCMATGYCFWRNQSEVLLQKRGVIECWGIHFFFRKKNLIKTKKKHQKSDVLKSLFKRFRCFHVPPGSTIHSNRKKFPWDFAGKAYFCWWKHGKPGQGG